MNNKENEYLDENSLSSSIGQKDLRKKDDANRITTLAQEKNEKRKTIPSSKDYEKPVSILFLFKKNLGVNILNSFLFFISRNTWNNF